MKVLIIEDEPIAVQRLNDMLREIDRDIQVVAVLDSITQAIDYLRRPYDAELAFVDIELGDGESFEIFRQVDFRLPVIFITAYREHTLQAFKHFSVDYLLKPLQKDELVRALMKFRDYFRDSKKHLFNVAEVLHAVSQAQAGGYRERFLARTGTRYISVPAQQIAYFYTRERMQYIKTARNEDLIIDKRLEDVEEEVNKKLFFRANRQFILNYNHIEKVNAWFGGKLKVQVSPVAYEEIVVSRLRAADFKKWLGE